ncbi:MAG: ATP-binding protein [Dehalococcoidia bacterium]|nr:MAG: ATP-binding protein [Dehalococcoidia bacterium]
MEVAEDVQKLRESLGQLPEATVNPAFIVVSGLPGTGKSYFCRKLAERLPFPILESDALRKVLSPSPNYSPGESNRLFGACHLLIEELLRRGIPLIFDATNLVERHRERLYQIANRIGARLIIVRVEAPPELVRQRLQDRSAGVDLEDKSEADWRVYQKMRTSVQRIRRNYFAVDTSNDITPVINKIVREVNR